MQKSNVNVDFDTRIGRGSYGDQKSHIPGFRKKKSLVEGDHLII